MNQGEELAPPAPARVDVDRPSAARMYDWYLGGTHNYAVDREFGKQVEGLFPLIKPLARSNRAWMNRVVRAAVDAGIRQFIDLGSGVPSVGNVHSDVRNALPEGERATVVYVDYEDVAAVHARITLEQDGATGWAGLVQRDLRDVPAILTDPEVERLIDPGQPVCLLLVAVLHFIGPADRPADLLGQYREWLAPGSWLALSHIAHDDAPPEAGDMVARFVSAYQSTSNPGWLRSHDEIVPFFGDWPLLEPGLVHLPDWRPDGATTIEKEDQARPFGWCGVAAKPSPRP
ncbi:hypothetical protein FNH05_23845 [Amycolatopsis rhizosphaerae]|uniref:S-adenosyl methyltransferase n=1 Tax=Amycolatopsis rhizosphaerae TaxID=2053003 RepID=A0A558BTA8_9PSEU|nr:SAM-dependent methyltransferase [Amycolatopsis rhizosphaerae]TVT39766.1 hypothetical protein FNH05_23845 [Amycolatopsis rhizosphaerae]